MLGLGVREGLAGSSIGALKTIPQMTRMIIPMTMHSSSVYTRSGHTHVFSASFGVASIGGSPRAIRSSFA